MSKFFVNGNQINYETNIIELVGDDVNHIKNVLRLHTDEIIHISTKETIPKTFVAKIEEIYNEKIICSIIEECTETSESTVSISIFQGIPKADKMELIIQKCTELGVNEIYPLKLNRCVVKFNEKDSAKKIIRWQKIAEVAAKQSGRDVIPTIHEMLNINDACNILKNFDCVLVAYEQENKNSLKKILSKNKNAKKIAVIIGPEGGFEVKEINTLKEAGANIVTLGKRILRTETAPITITSVIMYEFDEL